MQLLCPNVRYIKKRDTIDFQNYRKISLHNTPYKVLLNVILNMINPYANKLLGDYQAGFTHGKSTADQIHTFKQIMEKSHKFDQDVYLLFVGLGKTLSKEEVYGR